MFAARTDGENGDVCETRAGTFAVQGKCGYEESPILPICRSVVVPLVRLSRNASASSGGLSVPGWRNAAHSADSRPGDPATAGCRLPRQSPARQSPLPPQCEALAEVPRIVLGVAPPCAPLTWHRHRNFGGCNFFAGADFFATRFFGHQRSLNGRRRSWRGSSTRRAN